MGMSLYVGERVSLHSLEKVWLPPDEQKRAHRYEKKGLVTWHSEGNFIGGGGDQGGSPHEDRGGQVSGKPDGGPRVGDIRKGGAIGLVRRGICERENLRPSVDGEDRQSFWAKRSA